MHVTSLIVEIFDDVMFGFAKSGKIEHALGAETLSVKFHAC
jgi:hypothetical protein